MVKTEQVKSRRAPSAKGKVTSAIPHVEIKPTVFSYNGVEMTEEQMLEHVRGLAPKHPWIGTIVRLGTIAVGFSATYALSISLLSFMLAGSTSLLWMGFCLFVYFLVAFIGYLLAWKASDKTGEYFEVNGFDKVTSTVKGWFTRKEMAHV